MIIFDNNELEIAVVTYNRPNYIKNWLEHCYEEIMSRNISLSIYDSSTNNDTETFIKNKFNEIKYIKCDSNIPIGYKPLLPILYSKAKYLWISGDSRRHDFLELDRTVFRSIKDEISYILISAGYNNEYAGKVNFNKNEFIKNCFISSTCIGLSIYRNSLFDRLKNDKEYLLCLDKKFKNNYGFSWLGYFYTCFADNDYSLIYYDIPIINVIPGEKKQFWTKKFYECWIENLCEISDNIPNCYNNKRNIPRMVWNDMNLDSVSYCHKARINNGLNREVFYKYFNNGMLNRVSNKISRINFFATAPMFAVEIVYLIYVVFSKFKGLVKKLFK